MHTRTGCLVLLLTAGIALAPGRGWGQEVPGPADPGWSPLPLYHDRPETGGFYAAGEFVFWRMTNPIKQQLIAVRGLDDVDGSLQVARNILNPNQVDPTTQLPILESVPNPNGPQFHPGDPNFANQPLTILQPIPQPQPVPGAFFGSGAPALDANQVSGPGSYQPGFGLTLGWRFGDGFALEFVWRHLMNVTYSAVASVIPPTFNIGRNGEDQFLFSPVFNFPPEFAGPPNKLQVTNPSKSAATAAITITPTVIAVIDGVPVPTGNTVNAAVSSSSAIAVPQAAYGIWNAATIMSEDFQQRYDEYSLIGRLPVYQDDCSRWYGIFGLRHVALWERFHWRTESVATSNPGNAATVTITNTDATVSSGAFGPNITAPASTTATITSGATVISAPAVAGADDVADYINIVSNQMYGPLVGCGSEWYLGWGLSFALDVRATLAVDIVHEIAKYQREDMEIAHKRGNRQYTIVPEVDAIANLYWYPLEGIEVRAGYDFFNFFNTIASPRPVDFNYGAVSPAFEKGTYRMIDGFHAGIAFIF
jgi:hypothetical protein